MITLSSEIKKLLDRLYNLRSEDSVILSSIETSRNEAQDKLAKNNDQKIELLKKIDNLTGEEGLLKEQSSKLLSVLSGITEEDFSIVLEKLDISFHPRDIEQKLNSSLPSMLEKVVSETEEAKQELKNVEENISEASTMIEELGIRKDMAIANQQKLNEYFELALNGNLNITRDSISSLLEQFDFSIEEQKEAAKILMFPEDALYEYDDDVKKGTSISDVFAQAKLGTEASDNKTSGSNKDTIVDLMKKCGVDYLDYTATDLEKIAQNYDENLVQTNINFIKQNGIALDVFSDNVELLYDRELINKINLLLGIGKSTIDIYLNPDVLKKYDVNKLNEVISNFEKSGLDPKLVPLMAF